MLGLCSLAVELCLVVGWLQINFFQSSRKKFFPPFNACMHDGCPHVSNKDGKVLSLKFSKCIRTPMKDLSIRSNRAFVIQKNCKMLSSVHICTVLYTNADFITSIPLLKFKQTIKLKSFSPLWSKEHFEVVLTILSSALVLVCMHTCC